MVLASDMLWAAAIVAAPILFVALLIGLVISIFQVATQIQEMTLTFVPKIVGVFFVLIFGGNWMLLQLISFSENLIRSIPEGL